MLPSDHFVRFYNEVFKYIIAKGPEEIRKYYDVVSRNQERHCLELFAQKSLRGMYEYWEHIRFEENCKMENHLEEDCFWFTFSECPSLSKAIDNDASLCPEYCNHCPGWILPLMSKTGHFAVYNLVDRKVPRCEMYVYRDMRLAKAKRDELVARYGEDVVKASFDEVAVEGK